jgi:hypothetical protein
MKKRLSDWSLNLEEEYYAEHPEQMLQEIIQAAAATVPGCYVNVVVHENAGDPRDGLLEQTEAELRREGIPINGIQYIDQCGCGGYVFRIYR